jgi:uncharacterized membrane protein YphA (DoxX/SURF4 family)
MTTTTAPARDETQAASTSTIKDWVGFAFRLVFGVVLLVAGGLKITELDESARAVKAYRLFDPAIAELIGYAMPPLQIVIGLLLIVGLFTRIAAFVAGGLMVVFIIGIATVWVRGISIECGCFTAGGDLAGPVNDYEYARAILRDVVLLGMAAWLVVRPRTVWSLDGVLRPHLHREDSANSDAAPIAADLDEDA